jgi:two-component system response regulator DevR
MIDSIRVMLIDDHGIVRQGLRSILELEQGIEVVGEAGDHIAGFGEVERLQPDIVLLDLSLGPDGAVRGLEACQQISSHFSDIGVIILTTFLEEHLVLQALRNGAKGYILKDVDARELAGMIRAVQRGEAALDTRISALVLKHVPGMQSSERNMALDLSEREKEVLRLMAAGYSNRKIGEQICISQSTVKYHVRNIMNKLDVRHRTEVIYAASKLGLI